MLSHKLVVAAILASVGVTALLERAAHADSMACSELQDNTEAYNSQIIAKLEEKIVGKQFRLALPWRKIRIDDVPELYADDNCKITFVTKLTLDRKLLPDRHGTAKVHVRVPSAELVGPTTLELYVDDIRVTDVNLSALDVVDEFWERMANFLLQRLPDWAPITITL